MGRILAIDYGFKRVGLAVTDPLRIIAGPLEMVHSKDLFTYLDAYFKKESVDIIVIGMPKDLDNNATDSTSQVVGVVRTLRKKYENIKVIEYDERFTSKIAFQRIIETGVNKKKRKDKGEIDIMSAIVILQDFMSSRLFNEMGKL